jgi:nitrate reductase NapE component
LWLEEGVELSDDLIDQLKNDLINVLLIITIVQWSIVGIGAALIIGFLIWFFIALNRSKRNKTIQNGTSNGTNL